MSILGISSAHSAHSAYSAYSAYSSEVQPASPLTRTNPVKDDQENSGAKKLPDNNPLTGEINDEAIISDQAKKLLESEKSDAQNSLTKEDEEQTEKSQATQESEKPKQSVKKQDELTPEQKQELAELKNRDTEVKAHEQAHRAAAAGISASAPSYDYETGPDGKKYAVGGEVNISFVEGGDPKENISNAQVMKAAALAPANPSAQDRSVARHADSIISQNKEELIKEKNQPAEEAKNTETTETASNTSPMGESKAPNEIIDVKNNPLTGEITQNIKQTPLTKK